MFLGAAASGRCPAAGRPGHRLEVETPEANLSRAMQWVNQKYAPYVNRRYHRVGHLFQGRFKSALVEGGEYLDRLTRYIHLNPVRAGVVEHPADHRWSSYRDYVGLRQGPAWLERSATLRRFGQTVREQRRQYRAYVERSVAEDPLRELVFGAVVGSQSFVEWARDLLKDKSEDREISQLRRAQPRPSVESVCEAVGSVEGIEVSRLIRKGLKRNESRDLAIYLARLHSGLRLEELGAHFGGISGAAVSHACRRVEARAQKSRTFRKKVAAVGSRVHKSHITETELGAAEP